MAYMELNLYSKVLSLELPVSLIMPQPRPGSGEPLRTLWLYHGSTGDHTLWARLTHLELYAAERNLAVVIPTAHKSLFTNMLHGQDYGTYLGEELVCAVRRIFPCLSARRQDNYIGGLSNGAYGALRIGLRYPETFSAIGAFSGGDFADRYYTDDGTYRGRRHVMVFGEGCPAQSEHGVRYLAQRLLERGGPYPRIYHAAGTLEEAGQGDELTDFFQSLPENPFCYQFQLFENMAHEWRLWDRALLEYLEGYLGLAGEKFHYYI